MSGTMLAAPTGTLEDKIAATPRAEMTGLRAKLIYGFGSIAFGVKDQGFSTFLLFFYNQVIGLPAIAVGSAIAVALLADAFLDPVIGQLSDNLRTRWGRRHPLMYASAIPLAVSYWFLWNPPAIGATGLVYYLIGVTILVRTLISLYEVPSSAMLAELTYNYDQRTSMFGYRSLFGIIGSQSMTLLSFGLFFKPSQRFPEGQLDPGNYPAYALTAGIVMAGAIFISSIGTHRYIRHFAIPPRRERVSLHQIAAETLESVRNRAFIVVTLSTIFNFGAGGIAASIYFYFLTFFWGLNSHEIFLITLAMIPGAPGAMFLAPYLSKRFGKKRGTLGLWVISILTNWAPFGLRMVGLFPENDSPSLVPALLLFFLFGNLFAIANGIIMSSMIADIVEDSQMKTGRRSEGLFFAANAFAQKAVSGVGGVVAGLILSVAHFPEHAKPGNVTPEVMTHLAMIAVPVIVGVYSLSMLLLIFYNITRESHQRALCALGLEG